MAISTNDLFSDNVPAQGTAHLKLEAFITNIITWMALHRWKLNDEKTEYLLNCHLIILVKLLFRLFKLEILR